jgi:glutaminyl-tRNA synthetase
LEPSLADAPVGEHYQFQRIGYFNVDEDSNTTNLVFNKTVGLRDSWSKKSEATPSTPVQKPINKQPPQKSPVNLLQQLGKKYPNLPEEKRLKVREELAGLANSIAYDELEPLFGTAIKKTGTRIAVMIVLSELIKNGMSKNEAIDEFIAKGLEDKNQLLVEEASRLS